jgi:aminopeptidase N
MEKKFISGECTMKFKTSHAMNKLQLDLFSRYAIDEITIAGVKQKFYRDSNHVFILFSKSLEANAEYRLVTRYSGYPIEAKRAPWDGGFVWKKDSGGNHWVGVACEGLGASSWWPCKDHWSDEPDNGVYLHFTIPSSYIAVANGRLISKKNMGETTRFDWLVTNPINLYSVTLNIAKYENIKSQFTSLENGKTLDINYWVLPENAKKAEVQFEQVIPMLLCYEARFGPYPFYEDGYQLVETSYLGMEHQSCVAYGNNYQSGYKGNKSMTGGYDFDYIIIHETGHEWYGNNITAADNADMWIHEAFTTYAESIYAECMYGPEAGVKYMQSMRSRVSNKSPILGQYGVGKEGSGDMYAKGALFIHTLRCQIDNDSIWYDLLKEMHNVFKHKTTNYNAILSYFNAKSKMNLRPIFEAYLTQSKIPELRITNDKKTVRFELKNPENDQGKLILKIKYKLNGVEQSTVLTQNKITEIPALGGFEMIKNNYLDYSEN